MQFNASTPRKTLSIDGANFTVPQPFTEGHVLTPNEASALNQLVAENMRNNLAGRIKKAVEAHKEQGVTTAAQLPPQVQTQLQQDFDKYAGEYEFGERRTTVTRDPVEQELYGIARDFVVNGLKAKGFKAKQINDAGNKEKVETLIAQSIEKNPDWRKTAEQNVKRRQDIGKKAFDLGEIDLSPAAAPAPTQTENAPAA